jgi:hypothetical protein
MKNTKNLQLKNWWIFLQIDKKVRKRDWWLLIACIWSIPTFSLYMYFFIYIEALLFMALMVPAVLFVSYILWMEILNLTPKIILNNEYRSKMNKIQGILRVPPNWAEENQVDPAAAIDARLMDQARGIIFLEKELLEVMNNRTKQGSIQLSRISRIGFSLEVAKNQFKIDLSNLEVLGIPLKDAGDYLKRAAHG